MEKIKEKILREVPKTLNQYKEESRIIVALNEYLQDLSDCDLIRAFNIYPSSYIKNHSHLEFAVYPFGQDDGINFIYKMKESLTRFQQLFEKEEECQQK